MTEPCVEEDDVERSVTDHLVGDVQLTALRIASLGLQRLDSRARGGLDEKCSSCRSIHPSASLGAKGPLPSLDPAVVGGGLSDSIPTSRTSGSLSVQMSRRLPSKRAARRRSRPPGPSRMIGVASGLAAAWGPMVARGVGTDCGWREGTAPPVATSETNVLVIYPRTFAKCSPHPAEFAIFTRNLRAALRAWPCWRNGCIARGRPAPSCRWGRCGAWPPAARPCPDRPTRGCTPRLGR